MTRLELGRVPYDKTEAKQGFLGEEETAVADLML
jgi:hypothetical protein